MPPFGPKMTEELRKCRALANALDRAVDDLGLETNRGEGSVSSMVKLWPHLNADPKSVSKRTIARAQAQPSTTPNGSAAGRDVGERRGQVRSPAHPCLHFTHTRPPPPALGVAISALDFRALVLKYQLPPFPSTPPHPSTSTHTPLLTHACRARGEHIGTGSTTSSRR